MLIQRLHAKLVFNFNQYILSYQHYWKKYLLKRPVLCLSLNFHDSILAKVLSKKFSRKFRVSGHEPNHTSGTIGKRLWFYIDF